MSKVMTKGCTCNELEDELKNQGWTCYAFYDDDNELNNSLSPESITLIHLL